MTATKAGVVVAGESWRHVESLLESGPNDRHFVAIGGDDGSVTVRFGDGVHGARPSTDEALVCAAFRTGVGATGNRPGTDDPAIALLDMLGAVADMLSWYADQVAAEAYLETDRVRVSMKDRVAVQEALRFRERYGRLCLCFYPAIAARDHAQAR
jgi:hypothetical protein